MCHINIFIYEDMLRMDCLWPWLGPHTCYGQDLGSCWPPLRPPSRNGSHDTTVPALPAHREPHGSGPSPWHGHRLCYGHRQSKTKRGNMTMYIIGTKIGATITNKHPYINICICCYSHCYLHMYARRILQQLPMILTASDTLNSSGFLCVEHRSFKR